MAELVGLEARLVFDSFHRPLFDTTTSFDDGSVIKKKLSFENFKKALGISTKVKKLVYSPVPVMPKYFYKGGMTAKENTFWVSLFVPAGKHQYCIAQTNEFMQLAYPGLFFVLEVSGGSVKNRYCYAISDTVLTDNSVLYHYPYGHVSDSGSICMGSCTADVSSISNAHAFVESFLSGKDAGHSYRVGCNAKPKVPLRKLVGMVKEKGEFPTEWLMPYKVENKAVTVGSVINELACSCCYEEN